MGLRDELLVPIAGGNPGGVELRYDPLYDKIKEARREDDDAPQGEWQTERKTADWSLVLKLSKEALTSKSKDLQLAAWLTEALLKREGIAGLRSGLDLLHGMLEQFWDNLYPEIDDGDAEMRAAPLEWVGSKLDVAVLMAPVTKGGHTYLQYKESRAIPTEKEAQSDDGKATLRGAALADGKLSPEDFEKAFAATPKAWYKQLLADVDASLETLDALDGSSREKFGDVAPGYGTLRGVLEEVQRAAKNLLKRKLELEPDPVEVAVAIPGGAASAEPSAVLADVGPSTRAAAPAGGTLAVEPTSRDDAASRIAGAARYLRRTDPYNPASYLLLRGFRWGELRAGTGEIDPRLLEAPPTQTRTQLKGLLLDGKWPELLETAETILATPQGRGWLDLQRYALTALAELGSEYDGVAQAIRGELRALLTDQPQLLDMTLMDDTPTANAETRAWLRKHVLTGGAAAPADEESEAEPLRPNGDGRTRDPRALAQAEVRAGRTDRAIALLMREASTEKTRRGRFLCQTQLASIMVDSGHEPVAGPILEELLTDIETHQLESWEAGDMVAQPLALLYRCLAKSQEDPNRQQELYLRICRLDPLQAMSFDGASSGDGASAQEEGTAGTESGW